MTDQRLALDDAVRSQTIPRFKRDPLAVGKNIARGEGIWTGQAVALNFLAAIAIRSIRAERCRLNLVVSIFSLHAVERTLVASEHGFVDAGLVVTKQSVELRPFELQIQATDRGGVITLLRAVSVNRVVTARVDDTGKAGLVFFFVAVVRHRHQPFAGDTAFSVECNTPIKVQFILVIDKFFQPLFQPVEANCASRETDYGPWTITGIEPGFDALRALYFAVLKIEADGNGAGCSCRFEFDIGDAVIAVNSPYRLRTFKAGQLAGLLGINFDGGRIGCGNAEIANRTVLDGLTGTVSQAHGNTRPRYAVCNQHRQVFDELGFHRRASEI